MAQRETGPFAPYLRFEENISLRVRWQAGQ